MTSSYLVLTPPPATIAPDEKTRFVRDGFSLLAFLFPVLWLLAHRLWFLAIPAFLLQSLGGAMIGHSGLWPAGAAIIAAVSLLAGLEGQNMRIRKFASAGWKDEAIIRADCLDAAEEIYFSLANTPLESHPITDVPWDRSTGAGLKNGHSTSLGLFGFDGGR